MILARPMAAGCGRIGGGDAGTGGGASGTSVDDTDAGWGEAAGGAAEARDEARLRADRPPHHDQGW